MIKSFISFLIEAAKVHATTGHLPHVEALLYEDPSKAFRHFDNTVNRFQNKPAEGKLSQKADGGTSVKIARMPDGTPAVAYKTGKWFTNHQQIEDHAKKNDAPHYRDIYKPLLNMVSGMKKLKRGTAIQADIIYQSAPKKKKKKTITPTELPGISQPNTIKYKIEKGHKLVLAAHSQYRVNKSGELKKTSSHPDVRMLSAKGVHAPELAMKDNIKLQLSPQRTQAISDELASAKKSMTPEVTEFASGVRGLHPKFTQFFDQYHSHASRTNGVRSVEGLRDYMDGFMSKKAQSSLKPATQTALRTTIGGIIDTHAHHFGSLFNAHNSMIRAKHHVLDQMREHEGQFQLQTHGGEEHEGIVSSIGTPGVDEHQAKFVREGPAGFPKKNTDNERTFK